jgi:hypothetical protein
MLAGTTIGDDWRETFVAILDESGAPSWARSIMKDDGNANPLVSTVSDDGAIYYAGISTSASGVYYGKLVP